MTDMADAGIGAVVATAGTWTADWLWGLPIIAITLAVHFVAVVMLATALSRVGLRIQRRPPNPSTLMAMVIVTACTLGWMLAVVHGFEASIWAIAYMRLGAATSFGDAMLYSLDSMTARGASGLQLERHWKMLGVLEAVNGLLLFGISTAFLATVIVEMRIMLHRSRRAKRRRAAAQ
jgi:hypothetical protein